MNTTPSMEEVNDDCNNRKILSPYPEQSVADAACNSGARLLEIQGINMILGIPWLKKPVGAGFREYLVQKRSG